jgi:hypothetical protein
MVELLKTVYADLRVAAPPLVIFTLVFGVVERLCPVIEHKPLKGWLFNIRRLR